MAIYSCVYLVATGELIEIGPAGTDWGGGIHAPPKGAQRTDPEAVSEELQAERARWMVVERDLSEVEYAAFKSLSKGGGGNGINQTADDVVLASAQARAEELESLGIKDAQRLAIAQVLAIVSAGSVETKLVKS